MRTVESVNYFGRFSVQNPTERFNAVGFFDNGAPELLALIFSGILRHFQLFRGSTKWLQKP